MTNELSIEIVTGDITHAHVDAIVNAANAALIRGGGVDAAIHRAAGLELQRECLAIGGCPTGEARLTRGYALPARFVIHTVGPIWAGGSAGEKDLLAACYRSAIALARRQLCTSIAFPAISTGIYGYPLDAATRVALGEVYSLGASVRPLALVRFVCFDQATRTTYERIANELRIPYRVPE